MCPHEIMQELSSGRGGRACLELQRPASSNHIDGIAGRLLCPLRRPSPDLFVLPARVASRQELPSFTIVIRTEEFVNGGKQTGSTGFVPLLRKTFVVLGKCRNGKRIHARPTGDGGCQ